MAGRIPQEFIDELIRRVDIVELIDSRVPLKKASLLTRDPRMKERKKYGQPGARARYQYSKR